MTRAHLHDRRNDLIWIGIVAGSNAGTIDHVTATGIVNGMPLDNKGQPWNIAGVIAGGLVGQNGTLGDGGHSGKQGSSLFPDTLRWLWRDWPKE